MFRKKSVFFTILVVSCLLPSLTWASVSDIDKAVNNSGKSASEQSSSTGTSTYNGNGNGSYHTDVHLIGNETLYVRNRFSKFNFTPLVEMIVEAKAFENLESLIHDGRVSELHCLVQQGPLVLDQVVLNPGDSVTLDDLKKYWAGRVTVDWIWALLQNAGVLDAQGYLMGIKDDKAVLFSEVSFEPLLAKIKTMDLGIKTTPLQADILGDVYTYIVNEEKVLQITQQESTRYNSTGKNFFESFVDSFLGNALGSFASPDKVKVVRQKAPWAPITDVLGYFNEFYTGFLPHPDFSRNNGLVGMNGKLSMGTVEVMTSTFDDGTSFFSTQGFYRFIPQTHRLSPSIGFGEAGIIYNHVSDSSETIKNLDALVGVGGAGPAFLFDFNLGLTYRDGVAYNSLGALYRVAASFYPFKPFSLDFSAIGRAQPNLILGGYNWEYSEYNLGLSAYLSQASLGVGYHWMTSNDSIIGQGVYLGANYHF